MQHTPIDKFEAPLAPPRIDSHYPWLDEPPLLPMTRDPEISFGAAFVYALVGCLMWTALFCWLLG